MNALYRTSKKKFVKNQLYILYLFSSLLAHSVGVDKNTLIAISIDETKLAQDLKIGDPILCFDRDSLTVTSTITGIREVFEDSSVKIVTEENVVIIASNTERFFLPEKRTWTCAENLKPGDYILNKNFETIRIEDVEKRHTASTFLVISVAAHHNFFASEGNYLVHNGPIAAIQAYWTVKIGLYTALGATVTGTMLATGGAVTSAAAAYAAGTATATTIVTGVTSGVASATVGTIATGSATAGVLVGASGAVATVTLGAEAGVMATAAATGISSIATVSSAAATTGAATGVAGICAATAAAIEASAAAAFTAALVCPFTPW